MKQIKLLKILFPIYLLATAYTFYIGYYETIYSIGLIVAIATQVLGLLLFGSALVLTKYNLRKSLKVALIVVLSIQGFLIIGHRIEQYTPTCYIKIPANYVGPVYLFYTDKEIVDVTVNERGIGYVGHSGNVEWEVERGSTTMTEVLASRHSKYSEIIIPDSAKGQMISYKVLCFTVNDSAYYPPRPSGYIAPACMNKDEFLELINQGLVNETILKKEVWINVGGEEDWIIDTINSRF